MVHIMGAGLAGATLAYLLKQRGIDFQIYDIPQKLHCGLGSPCGFGVNRKDFLEACQLLDLPANKYVTRHDEFTFLDSIKVKADLATIDKPRLIADLLGDTEVKYNEAELSNTLVVDATGTARAYSPALESDFKVLTTQRRVKLSRPTSPWFYFSPGVGYAWLIPLSADGLEVHLGAGAIRKGILQGTIGRLINSVGINVQEIICTCGAWIRATGPILPMVNGNAVTIGEAAGLVSPLSGGGNIPAMLSALSLASNLDSPKQYEREMARRFGYFHTEEKVLRSFLAGRVKTPRNLIAMWRVLHFVGIYPNPSQYWRIIQTINHRLAKPPKV